MRRFHSIGLGLALAGAWVTGCQQQVFLPNVIVADAAIDRLADAGMPDRAISADMRPDASSVDQMASSPRDASPGLDVAFPTNCDWVNELEDHYPEVIIALDRSASMYQMYGGATTTRLEGVQQTLRSVLRAYREAIHFGYIEFPGSDCDPHTCCIGDYWIRPDTDIVNRVDKAWHCDGDPSQCAEQNPDSPASTALATAQEYFHGNKAPTASRHVFLIADGEPSCSSVTDKTYCESSIDQVVNLRGINVRTSVYGISPEVQTSVCLENLAASGGGASAAGQSHYVALTDAVLRDQLDAPLQAIAKEACTFGFDPLQPGQSIVVRIDDDTRLPRDTTHVEGWDYDSEARMSFTVYGKWCETLRTEHHDFDIEVCPKTGP